MSTAYEKAHGFWLRDFPCIPVHAQLRWAPDEDAIRQGRLANREALT
jgi:hypothetical protein